MDTQRAGSSRFSEFRSLAWRVFVRTARTVATDRVSLAAAGCAFYATLSLIPAITMLISVYGLAFNPATVAPQLTYLRQFMPPEVYSLIANRIHALISQPAQGLSLSAAVSLAVSLWSASNGTKSLMNALTLAYRQEEERGIFRFQFVALSMTLIATFGTALAIAVLVLIPAVLAFIGLGPDAWVLVSGIGYGAMLFFIIVALGLLYRYGPSTPAGIFFAPGAAAAALAWLLVSWLFGWYVGHIATYSALYGPLATIAGLMMWFFLTAYVVLFGAELNVALDHEWRAQKGQ